MTGRLTKGGNVAISVSMPRAMDDALQRAAENHYVSKSAFVRIAIQEKFDRDSVDKAKVWADAYLHSAKDWIKTNAQRDEYIAERRERYRQFRGELDEQS